MIQRGMKYCTVEFAGTELVLHGEKRLWFPPERLLCAADIHFEKGSFFRRFGTFLPPYDMQETLECAVFREIPQPYRNAVYRTFYRRAFCA